jgi:hypothetical protein
MLALSPPSLQATYVADFVARLAVQRLTLPEAVFTTFSRVNAASAFHSTSSRPDWAKALVRGLLSPDRP